MIVSATNTLRSKQAGYSAREEADTYDIETNLSDE